MSFFFKTVVLAGLLGPIVSAQPPAGTARAGEPKELAADPRDVGSIDSLMTALYHVISGPAGEARNWDRARTLFITEVRMISVSPDKAGKPNVRMITFPEYVERVTPIVAKQGFYESEIKRSVREFGNLAQVFSSYEIRHNPGEDVLARGVNALQLYFDGQRWWIASIVWDTDRPGNPLPKELTSEAGATAPK
jgi:hypothetical protein